MLSNKDMFNGMRLIKQVGIDKVYSLKNNFELINKEDITDDQKFQQGVGMIAEFLFDSICGAEYEVKKFLAEATGRKYDEIDKTSADEFLDIVEEFLEKHTVKEITDFFKRVLGLISKMR